MTWTLTNLIFCRDEEIHKSRKQRILQFISVDAGIQARTALLVLQYTLRNVGQEMSYNFLHNISLSYSKRYFILHRYLFLWP